MHAFVTNNLKHISRTKGWCAYTFKPMDVNSRKSQALS
jgi:hypothetical protein